MKVGTDGVLLGAWADFDRPRSILDIGTGTGLIALMMAQRYPESFIEAIEVVEKAAAEAERNAADSPFSDRIEVIEVGLQDFDPHKKYDGMICNPPFFRSGVKATTSRETSRHQDVLTFELLLEFIQSHLSSKGQAAVIIPNDRESEFMNKVNDHELFPQRLCRVLPTPEIEPKRSLLQFGRIEGGFKIDTLVIEDKGRHGYSDAYQKLTRDFYLKFNSSE